MFEKPDNEGSVLQGSEQYEVEHYKKPEDPLRVEFDSKFKDLLKDMNQKEYDEAFARWREKKMQQEEKNKQVA